MTNNGIFQILLYLIVPLFFIKPLGWYMAQVYQGKPCGLNRFAAPLEQFIYKLSGISSKQEMDWKTYLKALLIFNMLGFMLVYLLQRCQFYLPLNPADIASPSPELAFNTAISFISNTNWQAYSGEKALSYLTQMLALTVQNFLSAATGMAVMVAFTRGISRSETQHLGNFWVDLTRSVLYILLPLAFFFAIILVSQGVIQNFKSYEKINLLQPITYQTTTTLNNQVKEGATPNSLLATQEQHEQLIPMGPVASQIAIKQLGTNGGGFFNTNSAHPFENPTPISNFLEMLALILIPAALCYTYGLMVHDKRQGWAILVAMYILYIPFILIAVNAEQAGNPALTALGIDQYPTAYYVGGNMEGKEVRFGIVNSALWATTTTATANGSVNAMLDSFTPLGGFIPLWMMHLGEVVFGGVGSGLTGMLLLIIMTVFVAGLMVGRTPEYMGKKIEPYEMKMASLILLIIPLIILVFTSIAVVYTPAVQALGNPGAHGFTEILYAFTSMGSNNGSAFAGLKSDTPFYNLLGGISMLIGRYWIMIATLAVAGSLAKKKIIPISVGTMSTHTPLFIILLVSIIIILGALSFLPALALGPIAEELILWRQHG